MQPSYVYIVTNKYRGTPYIGVTADLIKRNFEHKQGINPKSFTAKYNLDKLVYYEEHGCIEGAILREKKLKKFMREWKINLIEKENPEWRDLTGVIMGLAARDPRASRCEPEDDVVSAAAASSSNSRSEVWGSHDLGLAARDPRASRCESEDDGLFVKENENV